MGNNGFFYSFHVRKGPSKNYYGTYLHYCRVEIITVIKYKIGSLRLEIL